ncbi:MAG: hypothetical protein ACLFRB_01160 [Thiohalorhabdus sp.]|uniref:hypothetical protein n=1 Tax=Thiohalorhabdus sp. TaxID=3094134 RepID=UPI00397F92B6
MAINEHWGTGFEVNRDPNAGVRRDAVAGEDTTWTRATGKVEACSAEVHTIRPLTHELTVGGILGMGGTHLYVPSNADIRKPDGRPVHLEDIRPGDRVAAIYQEVEHRPFGVADEQGPERQLEALHLVVAPREHGEGEG